MFCGGCCWWWWWWWWADDSGGMPMGLGGAAGSVLAAAPALMRLPGYWPCGLGEVADETEAESYDLVEGLGDRGYGLCDAAAMVLGNKIQFPAA